MSASQLRPVTIFSCVEQHLCPRFPQPARSLALFVVPGALPSLLASSAFTFASSPLITLTCSFRVPLPPHTSCSGQVIPHLSTFVVTPASVSSHDTSTHTANTPHPCKDVELQASCFVRFFTRDDDASAVKLASPFRLAPVRVRRYRRQHT